MKISCVIPTALFALGLTPFLGAETHPITLDIPPHAPAAFGSCIFGLGNDNENTGIWPCNLWSNFDARNFSRDIELLKLEGGNAAILLFPFFNVDDPTTPAAGRLEQLRQLLDICEARGVGLTLRLGYAWDNGFSNATHQQQIALLVNADQRKLWYRYCEKTYALASRYHCFRGAFICWEDFWGFLGGATLNQNERKEWASYIHYPKDTVPQRNDPAMEEYFDYYDHVFAEDFFVSSQRYVPHLGMEARVDDDLIYKEGMPIKSFVHRKMFGAANLSDVYLYWGPFMGARNEGDAISAEQALDLLQRTIAKARDLSAPNAQLIISQFNYKDNTPGFSKNTRIAPDQLADFMRKSAVILRQQCTGVYTWSNISYYHNAINNGTFSSGSNFWEFENALAGIDGDRPCVSVFRRGSIRQRVEQNSALSAGLIGSESVKVEFSAKAEADGPCSVSLGSQVAELTLTGKGGWRHYSVNFNKPNIAGQSLRISILNGALVKDVILANHKQEMGSENVDFQRDVIYANLAWELSRAQKISGPPTAISGVTADGWILARATFAVPVKSDQYHITIDLSVPGFVPEQDVQLSTQPDVFLGPKLHLNPGPHQLIVTGTSTDPHVFLTLTFSHRQRPPGNGQDARELAAHVDSFGP